MPQIKLTSSKLICKRKMKWKIMNFFAMVHTCCLFYYKCIKLTLFDLFKSSIAKVLQFLYKFGWTYHVMSKTKSIRKLCAMENKIGKRRSFRNIKNGVELQENPELQHFCFCSFYLNIFWIFWRVIQKLEYQVSQFLYK